MTSVQTTTSLAPCRSPSLLRLMNAPLDPLNNQFPRLNLHNGENNASTLHVERGVRLKLTPTETNILLLLIKERTNGRLLHEEDRGWINAGRLHGGYIGITNRHHGEERGRGARALPVPFLLSSLHVV